jgi:hypothetical protein
VAFTSCLYLAAVPSRLIALNAVDLAIIGIYFVALLGIGFYLKGPVGKGRRLLPLGV